MIKMMVHFLNLKFLPHHIFVKIHLFSNHILSCTNILHLDGKQAAKRRKYVVCSWNTYCFRRGKNQDTEARKESHKLIEQKRRQRINEKISELRELLNYPDGSQNKSVVLQAAVESI